MTYKILLVEDDVMIAKETKEALIKAFEDIYVKAVYCAEDALEEIEAMEKSPDDPYDLVIADLNLGDNGKKPQETSGFEMLKTISNTYECQIMIRSASPLEEMAKYCTSMGLRGYLAKTGFVRGDLGKLIYEIREKIERKQEKMKKGKTLVYGELIYSYDDNTWRCRGDLMDLGKGYNELLRYFIAEPGKLRSAEDILKFLENNNANYEISENREGGSVSNRVYNRINQLRKKLEKFGYEKDEIIAASKHGGYYAKNLED